jgi:hypothetical protein
MITKSAGLFLILVLLFSSIILASSGVPISANAARAHAEIRAHVTPFPAHQKNSTPGETPFSQGQSSDGPQDGNFIASQVLAERIRQVLAEGAWQDLIKEESYLDMSSVPPHAMVTTYKKAAGDWENYQRQQTNFPSDGSKRPLQKYFSEWIAGAWQVIGNTTFAYDGNDMIGFYTDWDVDHDTFLEHQLWTEYKFDRYSNCIQVIEHSWNGEQWKELERFDNSYDDSWLPIVKLHSIVMDESGTIKPDYKIEMIYNKAYSWLMSEVTSTPIATINSWHIGRQKIYTRGAYGQVSLILDQVDDGGWRNERLTTFAHDDKSRQYIKIVQLWQNGSWSDSLKETTVWDEKGRASSIIEETNTEGNKSMHRWVYSYPETASGVADETGEQPGQYALTNYPNPFNPTTSVSINLPNADEVTLRVYDLQGRLITELLHNVRIQAGAHEITWHGRDFREQPVASGIYIFELSSGNIRKLSRGLLLK